MIRSRDLLAGLYLLLSLAAQSSAGQVAVVALGPGSGGIADSLSKALVDASVKVVPALTAAQAIDQHADKSALPDTLIVLRHDSPESKLWRMDMCDVATGVSLATKVWDQDQSPAIQSMVDRFVAIPPTTAPAESPPIAIVLPIDSSDFSQLGASDKDAARRGLESELRDSNLAMIDLRNAWLIGEQRTAAGAGPIALPDPMFISGKIHQSGQGSQFTVTLTLSYQGKTITTWTSQATTSKDVETVVSQGVDKLFVHLPTASTDRKLADVRLALGNAAKSLVAAGDFNESLQVMETALLFDPSNPALHHDAAISLCRVMKDRAESVDKPYVGNFDPEESNQRHRQFCLDHADEISWGVSHIQVYSIGSTIEKSYSKPEAGFSQTTNLAPAELVRTSIYNVFKAKHDANQPDEYAKLVRYLIQGYNAYGQSPRLTDDQQLEFAKHLADVWTFSANNGFELLCLLPFPDQMQPTPRRTQFLEYLKRSSNPDANLAEESIQKTLIDFANSKNRARQDRGPEGDGPPTVQAQHLWLPMDSSETSYGFVPAGPHADAYFTGNSNQANLYYLLEDGTGRKLGPTWNDSPPAFDGKYLWYLGRDKDGPFVACFNPATGDITADSELDALPRDAITRSRFLALEPGKVCLVSQLGIEANRTWVALANLNSPTSMSMKVIQTCDKPEPRWNEQPKDALPADTSFTVENMFLLPGPPKAGKNAKSQIYILRDTTGILLVDPISGARSVCNPCYGRVNGRQMLAANDKLYWTDKLWDPQSDTLKSIPPIPQAPTVLTADGTVYSFKERELFKAKLGEPFTKIPLSVTHRDLFQGVSELHYSNLFGLIYDRYKQLIPLPGHNDVPTPAVADRLKWFRTFANTVKDHEVYRRLVDMDEENGLDDEWGTDMANVIKTDDGHSDGETPLNNALFRAGDEVQLANYYMHRGDYMSAKNYADHAAETGAEWAIQEQAYVAEGMDDWALAEKKIRQAADDYGNSFAWYNWCVRTGHGDLASAKAKALAAADQADTPVDRVDAHAWADLFDGDQQAALDKLKTLATDGKNVQAALYLAIAAADAKDNIQRDKMLDLAASCPLDHGVSSFSVIKLMREFYANNGKLSPETLKEAQDSSRYSDKPILYLALGRAYFSIGDQASAAFYLQQAAGKNSYCVSRTFAVLELRKLGVPVPKPGQWDEVLKKSQ